MSATTETETTPAQTNGAPAKPTEHLETVVNYLVDQMQATVYNQAASKLLSVREREGA